jgi:4-amino-4-deoxy-L-arabinose transferase-like glycosyltransferase
LALICYLTLFTHNELLSPSLMEARNFISAREIVESGNWLIPTLNGEPRIAKPPLPTWLTALSARMGGLDNLNALRLPAALAATLMVLFCYGLGRTLTTPRTAFLAAAVLATCQLFIRMGRRGSWDIFCHSFMLGGIWALTLAVRSSGRARSYFILAGVGFGLAFMSKGPVPFYSMLLPYLIAGGLVYGLRPARWPKRPNWAGVLLMVLTAILVAVPWPLYILSQAGDLSLTVTQQEASAWLNRHLRPLWYYATFPVNTGLWAPFAVAVLIVPWMRPRMEGFGKYRFLLFWCLSALVLLSVVPEKKERYILPLMVPMAYLIGYLGGYLFRAGRLGATPGDLRLVKGTNLLLGLLAMVIAGECFWMDWQNRFDSNRSWLSIAVPGLIFLAGISFYNIRCRNWRLSVVMPGLLSCFLAVFALPYYARYDHGNPHFRSLAASGSLPQIKDLPLYSLGPMNPKQIWEVGRIVRPWQPEADGGWPEQGSFALFTRTPPETSLLPLLGNRDALIEVVDTFPYDPKKSERIWYLAVVRPHIPQTGAS